MPEFTYDALSKLGQKSNGTLTASNEREAAAMLDSRGLFPVQIKASKSKGAVKSGKKVKGRIMATFYGQLADLMHSGVPLLKAIDLLEEAALRDIVQQCFRDMEVAILSEPRP